MTTTLTPLERELLEALEKITAAVMNLLADGTSNLSGKDCVKHVMDLACARDVAITIIRIAKAKGA